MSPGFRSESDSYRAAGQAEAALLWDAFPDLVDVTGAEIAWPKHPGGRIPDTEKLTKAGILLAGVAAEERWRYNSVDVAGIASRGQHYARLSLRQRRDVDDAEALVANESQSRRRNSQ